MTQAKSTLPEGLRQAAGRGWHLFPCYSVPEGKCSCGNPECGKHAGKRPRTPHGHLDATTDERQLQIWAQKWPGCNWAVATGPKSGVFVLDVDGEKGRASLARLEAKYGPLPATLISRTGRDEGGEHRWLAYPVDCAIRSSTGELGEGLDIRGDGGYVIVPPSVHETGQAYQWINPGIPSADAPGWLKMLARSAEPRRDEARTIPMGQRNKTLASIAGGMRRKGVSEDEIRSELRAVNERDCRPQLPDEEVCKIAGSIARYDPAAKPNSHQPLKDFVLTAVSKNGLAYVCRTKWISPLFVFTRALKGRDEFAGADGYQAAQLLDALLLELFHDSDSWQSSFGDISQDPRAELIKTWDSVKSSSDGDALTVARESAKRLPLMPLRSYSSLYNEFVSMVGHLQHAHLDHPVAIPVKRFGELLPCHHTMVCCYRRWAENEGLLMKVMEYTAKQRAAEFLFALDKFDWETGEQLDSLSPEAIHTRVSVPNSHQTHQKNQIHHGLVRMDNSGENALEEMLAGEENKGYVEGWL